jgi:hypothetical protein
MKRGIAEALSFRDPLDVSGSIRTDPGYGTGLRMMIQTWSPEHSENFKVLGGALLNAIHDPFKLVASKQIVMCIRVIPYLPCYVVLLIQIHIGCGFGMDPDSGGGRWFKRPPRREKY